MARRNRKFLSPAVALGVAGAMIFMASPANADEPVGRQRVSGFMTCPAGQQVGIVSNGIGTVTRAWTTGGGPNAEYERSTSFYTLYATATSFTYQQAVTWYIEASPPGGADGLYGLADDTNYAFCT